jgi:lipid intermediate transporter
MPICIECRHPVRTLWTSYSGAGDKSSGHNIRLTVCRKCGRFCDKYVEHDFVVLFIDLVLIKPQVRHVPGSASSSSRHHVRELTVSAMTLGIPTPATQYTDARWRPLRRTYKPIYSFATTRAYKLMNLRLQPSIIRLGVLLLLFDVYLTWARIEKQTMPDTAPGHSNLGKLAQQPIVLQYMFFRESHATLLLCRKQALTSL